MIVLKDFYTNKVNIVSEIDAISVLCMDVGLALKGIILFNDEIEQLFDECRIHTMDRYSLQRGIHISTTTGAVRVVPLYTVATLQRIKNIGITIDSSGLVSCTTMGKYQLILLNKLMGLKIYNPSTV